MNTLQKENKKSLVLMLVVLVVVMILGVFFILFLSQQSGNNRVIINNNQSRYSCQQNSDCVLVPKYDGCCPAGCESEVMTIKEQKISEQNRDKQYNCNLKKMSCGFNECKPENKKAICEQNRCVAKEISPDKLNIWLDLDAFRKEKITYQKGELININIENGTANNVSISNITIEYFDQETNSYKEVDNDLQCPCGAKCEKVWIPIPKGETKKFDWNQETNQIMVGIDPADGKPVCVKIESGKYRIKVDYIGDNRAGAKQATQTIYSSEFTIADDFSNLSCVDLKKEITKNLDDLNYCQTKDDCTINDKINDRNWGCGWHLVNNQYEDDGLILIQNKIKGFGNCPNDVGMVCPLLPPTNFECIKNKCVSAKNLESVNKTDKILLTMSKTRYQLGEKVSITIKNLLNIPVWFFGGCFPPVLLVDGKEYWSDPLKDCVGKPLKLNPHNEQTFDIDLQGTYFLGIGKLESGIYKFKLWYTESDLTNIPYPFDNKNIKNEEINSNEFTIF
jgi:hypothetical protein